MARVGDGTAGPGRPPGLQNKMTKQLKEMILTALDKAGGEDYLLEQSRENPSAFMTLLGKVLPTTLAGDKDAPVHAVVSMVKIVGVKPGEKS